MMAMLFQEADMAVAGITISTGSRAVDFTYPYYSEPLAVIFKMTRNKWTYFMDPLSAGVALAFCFLPVVMAIAYTAFEGVHIWLWGPTGRSLYGSHDCGQRVFLFLEDSFQFVQIFFGQNSK